MFLGAYFIWELCFEQSERRSGRVNRTAVLGFCFFFVSFQLTHCCCFATVLVFHNNDSRRAHKQKHWASSLYSNTQYKSKYKHINDQQHTNFKTIKRTNERTFLFWWILARSTEIDALVLRRLCARFNFIRHFQFVDSGHAKAVRSHRFGKLNFKWKYFCPVDWKCKNKNRNKIIKAV